MTTPSAPIPPKSVSLLGFGEAGMAFTKGWRAEFPELAIAAYDIKTDSAMPKVAEGKWQDYLNNEVVGGETLASVMENASVVFSLVTADQAEAVGRSAAKCLPAGSYYFDCNSCAPDTKHNSATILEAVGIRYVDTAVMSPVHPKLHKAPLLISGPHVKDAANILHSLDMNVQVVPGEVGRASSIKMMRSIMIKGLEALTLECFLSARKAGVEAEVLASLAASFPEWNWVNRAAYNLERCTSHGIRRAAEMREVAKTVDDLGLNNGMSRAIVEWQQEMGDLNLPVTEVDLFTRADDILAAVTTKQVEKGRK